MAGKTATLENKKKIIEKFGRKAGDTGSAEVQIALITDRINHLNDHFKKHQKDHHSNRGLLKLVGQRKQLLNYLRLSDADRYTQVIKALELRK